MVSSTPIQNRRNPATIAAFYSNAHILGSASGTLATGDNHHKCSAAYPAAIRANQFYNASSSLPPSLLLGDRLGSTTQRPHKYISEIRDASCDNGSPDKLAHDADHQLAADAEAN